MAEDEPDARRLAITLTSFVVLCWAMLAIGNAPAPILHDMVEAFVWGQEFQLGYNQHPPFWAWLCGGWFSVLPRTGWSFAALAALNAGVGLAGAWALIGDFARGPRRVAAFALLLLTPIYTLGAYKYDANTIFLSVWPWTAHAFLRALRTRRLPWSLGFGALLGAAMLSKYYSVLLIALCALAALSTKDGRVYLRSRSPWISAALASAVFAPHAIWLLQTGAPPFRYFLSASSLPFSVVWRSALATAFGVAVWFVLVLAVVAYFARSQARPAPDRRCERPIDEIRLLTILGLGPLALTLAAGVALRVRLTPEMPIGGLALIPLLLIEAAGVSDCSGLARFARRAAVFAVVAMAALSPAAMLARAYVGKNAARVAPYREVAQTVTRLWRERMGTPLAYAAGGEYAHYIAFFSPDRPHAFFRFDLGLNLWVTRQDLARRGWAGACEEADAPCLAEAQPWIDKTTQRVVLSESRHFLGHAADPRRIVVFLTPPRGPG